MSKTTFYIPKFHYLAAIIFVVINIIAHTFSSPEAIYIHGADAGRYYSSALSLVNGDGFGSILGTGPLYPVFLAIHYFPFGFDYGNSFLVVTQALVALYNWAFCRKVGN